jgi:hypothetical protein
VLGISPAAFRMRLTGSVITITAHKTVSIGQPGQSPASPQSIRDDYTWLQGTAANLRLLTPAAAIPAGFTRVSPARSGGGTGR